VRRPLIIGVGLAIFQQVTGINTVIYFAPTIFETAGLSSASVAILATAGVGVVNVALTLVAIWLIDKVGRRALLLTGLAGMGICLLLLALGFILGGGSALGWITALSLAAYVVPRDRPDPIAPGNLRRWLADLVPDYMIPTAFVLLDSLPLTPNGKVDRQALPNPADVRLPLRPIETLTRELAGIDTRLGTYAAADPVVAQLQTVPGVGPVVALTFRATLDEVTRFRDAGQVRAFVGLVPREDSSAERRHRGHITKAGSGELRSLLIQAAWACWKSRGSGLLRAWAERLAGRRGRRIAVVALARRLSRILYAVWRDGTTFDGTRVAAA
jgi:hypothetical protein